MHPAYRRARKSSNADHVADHHLQESDLGSYSCLDGSADTESTRCARTCVWRFSSLVVILSHAYWRLTISRPRCPMASARVGSRNRSTTPAENSPGLSATRRCSPERTSIPSHPKEVETIGLPM